MAKKHFTLWMIMSLIIGLTSVLQSENLLVGSNMEDESAWNISHLDSDDEAEYEFNVVAEVPKMGSEGCLEVWCFGDQSNNILFWQEVTLIGGETYDVGGAFRDVGGNLYNFWCEILLHTEVPPDTAGADYGGGTSLLGINTWDGCGPGIDSTFQDTYCKGNGSVFTMPDSVAAGEEATFYFSVNVGVWTGGEAFEYDVVIDELFLDGVGGGSAVSEEPEAIIQDFELLNNYPNPFNPSTEIQYALETESDVNITIYNMTGQQVTTLINQHQTAGMHSSQWDGRYSSGELAGNGVYLCHMQIGKHTQTLKMILQK
ncbi:T9SS type A sorting domain-containing protein [candidate division KSB1 bacterium]|nr:T9SS type A sorting domain-containing protein [candidate division KSB1 bacterium]